MDANHITNWNWEILTYFDNQISSRLCMRYHENLLECSMEFLCSCLYQIKLPLNHNKFGNEMLCECEFYVNNLTETQRNI